VLTGGAGGRAMRRAFEALFGVANAFGTIPMPGRTDWWLRERALEHHGIASDDPRVGRFREVYVTMLQWELDQPPPPAARQGVLPGVRDLLDVVARRRLASLALLTGNYERAAQLKLQHFDLWRYFSAGAFGDRASDRTLLLAEALRRVEAAVGRSFAGAETVVIGDTPHDVAVAKAGGARSIAVATGSHSLDELRAAGADYVFQDLSNVPAVIGAIGLA
jgi:phosphoglycolate phosphatase